MERRDFLLLRIGPHREAQLSCEQLYMRFVDAQSDGTTAQLFDALARDLGAAQSVLLIDRSWLSSADLEHRLNAVLAPFVKKGGRVRLS